MKKSLFALFALIAAGVIALIAVDMMRGAEAVPSAVPQAAVQQASLLDMSTSNIDPDLAHVYEAKAAGTLDPNDPAYVRVLQRAVRDFEGRGGHSLDQGSDTCAATVIAAIPYFDSGTTAGRVDNFSGSCVGAGAPDVIYRFTPSITQLYNISLCGSSYDTGLIVKTGGACPGTTEVACDDDACGVASQLTVALTSGVTYWIIVDGYVGQSGAYVLNITGPPAPCVVTCPGGGIPEGEACPAGTDHFNGGCNSAPPVFSPITCGETVCGQCNTASGSRDTDWYSFTLTTASTITWTVRASFNVSGFIMLGVCPPTVIVANSALACSTLVLSAAMMPPATYYVFVAPADFNTLPCGNYVATLTCSSGIPGDNCASVIQIDSLPYTATGTTVGAADDYHCSGNTSPDVIYSFMAPDSGLYRISLCGSSFNTRFEIRTGGPCPGAGQFACQDDGCQVSRYDDPSPQSWAGTFLNGGTRYFIIVDGAGVADMGSYTLSVSQDPPPQTQSVTVNSPTPGTGVSVAVDCQGTVYYTNADVDPNMLHFMDAGGTTLRPPVQTVLPSAFHPPVRIEEMTWDNDHNLLWGGSGHVNGADVHPSQIYTIDPITGFCYFQFLGLDRMSPTVTSGLTYDHDLGAEGTIWQALEQSSSYTAFQLVPGPQWTHLAPITVSPPGFTNITGICAVSPGKMYLTSRNSTSSDRITWVDKMSGLNPQWFWTTGHFNEGLECDPHNFPGHCRLWCRSWDIIVGIGSYPWDLRSYFDPYEIPDGSCACTPPNCHVFTYQGEKFWMYCPLGGSMIVHYSHPWPVPDCRPNYTEQPPCANSNVYSWDPITHAATALTTWDWNVPQSAAYVTGNETRYINNTSGTGWYVVESLHPVFTSAPWDESCRDSFMVCYRCTTAVIPTSLGTRENYAGFILGGVQRPPQVNDGDFGHLTGNLVDVILQPGLNLQSLPLIVGPAGMDTLRLRYNIVHQNAFWRSMKFWAAVGDSGPAVLRIRASGAQLPDVTLAINGPGEYIAQLGAIADTGSHTLTLTTLSGNVMFDAWGTYSNWGGLCDTLPAERVTVLWIGNNAVIHFDAPVGGRYRIYSTTNRNIAFSPGTWTVETTLNVPLSGDASWTDPGAMVDYKRYAITQLCPDVP